MRRTISLCLASGGVIASLAGPVLDGSLRPWSLTAHLRAPSAAAATDPEGPGAVVELGRAVPLRTRDGRIVVVTVTAVRMRQGKHRLVDVRLRYALRRGGSYPTDAAREVQLIDASGQLIVPAAAGARRPVFRPAVLRSGQLRSGWVTFALPTAAGAARVQVTLEAGTGPRTGQWRVSARP